MMLWIIASSTALDLPAVYQLDPAASAVYVRLDKDPSTMASRLAHDHVIVATGWVGRVTWGGPGGCDVDVRVPTTGLLVDAPAWRRRVGLAKTVTEGQREDIRTHMLAEAQLSAAEHPWITFRAARCDGPPGSLVAHGTLSVRGVAHEVAVPVTVQVDGTHLSVQGQFTARATDFGFQPYSALLGAVKNRDEMTFVFDVTGVPATLGRSP